MKNSKKNTINGNNIKKYIKYILQNNGIYCILQTIDNMGCRLTARRLTVNQVIGGSNPSVPARADLIRSAFPLPEVFLRIKV